MRKKIIRWFKAVFGFLSANYQRFLPISLEYVSCHKTVSRKQARRYCIVLKFKHTGGCYGKIRGMNRPDNFGQSSKQQKVANGI